MNNAGSAAWTERGKEQEEARTGRKQQMEQEKENIVLEGLTPGEMYQVQILVNNMNMDRIRKNQDDGKPKCKTCKHFFQHYVYSKITGRFSECNMGHCTYPRGKTRKPEDVCDKYEKFESAEKGTDDYDEKQHSGLLEE